MSEPTIPQAVEIGRVIRDARLQLGYENRAQLVNSRPLKGKITAEGLRKIEAGERVPRLETIEELGNKLGLSKRRIKALQKIALETNIGRVTRRAGNVDVRFEIDGKPIRLTRLPAKKKVEGFVREVVDELTGLIDRIGGSQQDQDYFRRHARDVLIKRLEA